MKRLFPSLGMLAIVIFVLLGLLLIHRGTNNLVMVKESSYFSDFYVKSSKVYIECEVTIKNPDSADKAFRLNAILKNDVHTGLLKNENTKGYNPELTSDGFKVCGNSTQNFSVVFVGDFAGVNKKNDRNLPEIMITII